MMEMFAFGMLGGAVLTLIMIGVIRVGMDKGESVSYSDDSDNDSVDDRHNRGSDRRGSERIWTNRDLDKKYSQKENRHKIKINPETGMLTKEEFFYLEALTIRLNAIGAILGLCRAERETLDEASYFITSIIESIGYPIDDNEE